MSCTTEINPLTRIPLRITVDDKKYVGEALGKRLPSAKFYTCELDGLDIFSVEAVANPITKKYFWVTKNGNIDSQIMISVEDEIDRYMCAW